MDTEFEEIANKLWREYGWNSKDIDEGEFKIKDVIEVTKEVLRKQFDNRNFLMEELDILDPKNDNKL